MGIVLFMNTTIVQLTASIKIKGFDIWVKGGLVEVHQF